MSAHSLRRLMRSETPGVGREFTFHGSFASKDDAMKREKEVGGFIRETKIKGQKRYTVLKPKGR